jgi:hypothetical protein
MANRGARACLPSVEANAVFHWAQASREILRHLIKVMQHVLNQPSQRERANDVCTPKFAFLIRLGE